MVILHKYLELPEVIMDFRTALSSTLHNLQHPWEVLNDARLGEKKNVNVPGAWEPGMLVCFQSEMQDGYTPFFVFCGVNLPKVSPRDKRSNMRQPKPDPVPPPQALYTQNPCNPLTKLPIRVGGNCKSLGERDKTFDKN